MMTFLVVVVVVVVLLFNWQEGRWRFISRPLFNYFKKILPPLSDTEKQAMQAGSVWWDGELLSGRCDWQTLLSYPVPRLSQEEQDFINKDLAQLMRLLDDYDIVQTQRDLPEAVWDFLKSHGFFALIIPKAYGGKDFSAFANSNIVTTIATRSLSAAVTVMVPNSLGPAELLMSYGTQAQKEAWLSKLATGQALPCFALTGPEAGSDAGAISDSGVVCYGEHEGEQQLGIRLNWNKRYITLAPKATVLGLAFKLYDPEHLLGDEENIGISCALIPRDHHGVSIGKRHDPLGLAFMNGPTQGENVFIPLNWLIGGVEYAGQGWKMLMECLSAGRGISLPALGCGVAQLSLRSSSAYAYVRRQFGLSIGRFEGVEEALAPIAAFAYQLEAARHLTCTAIDLKQKPAIVTAISKYHMTELARKVLNHAMDIHAGKGIQLGPNNYLAHSYFAMPVAITVEGANILTRSLMIFGQGAIRCHPYVLAELQAASEHNEDQGLANFERLMVKHVAFAAKNKLAVLWQGLTLGKTNHAPVSGEMRTYYQQLTRMSRALALSCDVSLGLLGGTLKRRERLSARLGDVLSYLYLSSACLKYYDDQGRMKDDAPFVHWVLQYNLAQMAQAYEDFFANFPQRFIARCVKRLIFPWGINYCLPNDALSKQLCAQVLKPSAIRARLTELCVLNHDALSQLETAFVASYDTNELEQKAMRLAKTHACTGTYLEKIQALQQKQVLTNSQFEELKAAYALRTKAIAVDEFDSLH